MTRPRGCRASERTIAAAICCTGVLTAWPARAQDLVVLECNEPVILRARDFDPPVQGPLRFEWLGQDGRILGTAEDLERAFPVGQFTLTLVASAEGGRRAEARLVVEVRDTVAPSVRAGVPFVQVDRIAVVTEADLIQAAALSVEDSCDPGPVVRAEPTAPYPPGSTLVRLSATDASGNTGFVDVDVRTAPALASPGPAQPAAMAPIAPSAPQAGPADLEPARGATSSDPVPTSRSDQPETAATALPAAPTALPGEPSASLTLAWWAGGFGVLAAGLFLVVRRRRRPVAPARPAVHARARSDAGEHLIVSPGGLEGPLAEVRLRPRADRGEQRVEAEDTVPIREGG